MFLVGIVVLCMLVVWFVFVVATAVSPRARGFEKFAWILASVFFPVIGYVVFVYAKPLPRAAIAALPVRP